LNINGTPVPGRLADPTLELHDNSGKQVAFNDNWKESQETEIRATGLMPGDDLDSAMLQTLAPGPYTGVMRGKDNSTGIGLVEVYDLNSTALSQLANLSTRGFVGSNNDVMIGGFILGPVDHGNSRVVVRALGPSLSNAGVANSLQDPMLEVHDQNGAIIASNDDWETDTGASLVAASGLAPSDTRESALYLTLMPGSYTAIESGKSNSTGVGLVEIYNLQ
jgi:hypothetical protein